jgi:hypothetical protein
MLMANHTVVEQPTQMQNISVELTNHAVSFLSKDSHKPFFYLMAYVHVHSPLFTSPPFAGVSQGGRYVSICFVPVSRIVLIFVQCDI